MKPVFYRCFTGVLPVFYRCFISVFPDLIELTKLSGFGLVELTKLYNEGLSWPVSDIFEMLRISFHQDELGEQKRIIKLGRVISHALTLQVGWVGSREKKK